MAEKTPTQSSKTTDKDYINELVANNVMVDNQTGFVSLRLRYI